MEEGAVERWLEATPAVQQAKWMSPIILDIVDEENPLVSGCVKKFSENDEFKDHPRLKMFYEKCRKASFSLNELKIPEYKPQRVIAFKSNVVKDMTSFEPNRKIQFSPECSFFIGGENSLDFEPPVKPTEMKVKEMQVFLTSLKSFQCPEVPIEPILASAFLFGGGRIISEPWNFTFDGAIPFFERIGKTVLLNQKAAFNYDSVNVTTYLIVVLKRVLQADGGSACNKFYGKSSSTTIKNATDSVNGSWPALSHVFTPFCWTFAPVAELMSSKDGVELPAPMELSGTPTEDEFAAMIAECEASGQKKKGFPFKIVLEVTVKSVHDPAVLEEEENCKVLYSLSPLAIEPYLRFRNQMTIMLRTGKFKFPSDVKAKNIYAQISLRNGVDGEKLCVFVNQNSTMHDSVVMTTCEDNTKNPVFSFLTVVDLPRCLSKDLCIVVEYYTVLMKKGNISDSAFGSSVLPLFQENGFMIENGLHTVDVDYKASAKTPEHPSTADLAVYYSSCFVSSDPVLTAALDRNLHSGKLGFSLFPQVKPEVLVYNLCSVVDELVNSVVESPCEAVEALDTVASLCAPIFDGFEDFLVQYATQLAFRENFVDLSRFPSQLLDGWGGLLKKYGEKAGVERSDAHICDCLFLLYIKALKITGEKDIGESFRMFVSLWTESVAPLTATGFLQAKKFVSSFASFLNLIADLGHYDLAYDAIKLQFETLSDSPNDHKILMFFLGQVLRPKLFLTSIVNIPRFGDLITDLVLKAKSLPDSFPFHEIFYILLGVLAYFKGKEGGVVTAHLVRCLTIMTPLARFPFTNTREICPATVFYLYLLKHITEETFKEWWQSADQTKFFESVHFVIDRMKLSTLSEQSDDPMNKLSSIESHYSARQSGRFVPGSRSFMVARREYSTKEKKDPATRESEEKRISESVYAAQFSVINVIQILCNIHDGSEIPEITKVIYHLMCTNLSIDVVQPIMVLLVELLSGSFELVLMKACPTLTKLVMKVFELSIIDPDPCSHVISCIFKSDKKLHSNRNRSWAVCTRALYMSSDAVLAKVTEKHLTKLRMALIGVNKQLKCETEDIDMIAGSFYRKSLLVQHSPDSRYDCLKKLAEFHRKHGYYAEEVQTMLLQAALVLEYMTICGKMPKDLWNMEHPALVFSPICSSTELAVCPPQVYADLPLVPTYCDSVPFTPYSLVEHLMAIVERCRETQQYEIAGTLIDYMWPILEKHRAFSALQAIMQKTANVYSELGDATKSEDNRIFGRYFRVCFFGTHFQDQNGHVYVYRTKTLEHLWDFADNIIDTFKKVLQEPVELIKESGIVDASKLDPEKSYIQVTFIEPFIGKHDTSSRVTHFEKSTDFRSFFCDTPFVKGGNQAQGSVEQQWLSRAVLTVKYAMPYFLRRQVLGENDITITELQPIRVSYRQLKMRVNTLKEAIERVDFRQIQQLLHGSLLTQVNEGPSKLAEVFLSKGEENKYTHKLKEAFVDFVNTHEAGLKLHAKFVAQNPAFVPLQHELETSFASLKEIIEGVVK